MQKNLSYSCMDCNRISQVANTHNQMGLPSYCPVCLQIKEVEKAQRLYDQYPSTKEGHIAEGKRIVRLYEDACKLLGKTSIEAPVKAKGK